MSKYADDRTRILHLIGTARRLMLKRPTKRNVDRHILLVLVLDRVEYLDGVASMRWAS